MKGRGMGTTNIEYRTSNVAGVGRLNAFLKKGISLDSERW
jgi:hypothetical protein